MIAGGPTDPINDTIAGAVIGLFAGLFIILAMSIGRRQWRGILIRLASGMVGGLIGGAIGGFVQAVAFPGSRFMIELLLFTLVPILFGAIIGALVAVKLAARIFRGL